MPLYLVGMPGSGKSFLGNALADLADLPFIDTDDFIEKKYKKSIKELFEIYGEEWFRKEEHNALKTLSFANDLIIATGGGLPCFHGNMNLMNEKGDTIYLQISAEELSERILSSNKMSKSPLYGQLNKEQLIEYLKSKLNEREPFYNRARLSYGSHEHNANFIYKDLKKNGYL